MSPRRRWLIFAAVAVAVVTFMGTAVGIQERFERERAWAFSEDAAPLLEAKFHQGKKPCRRYVVARTIAEPHLDRVAKLILERGWLSRMNDLIALGLTSSEDEERRHHQLHRGEELRELVLERLSATDKFWLQVIGRAHLDAIVELADEQDVAMAERAKGSLKRWTKEERVTLRTAWRENPAVFSNAGVAALMQRLQAVVSSTTSN